MKRFLLSLVCLSAANAYAIDFEKMVETKIAKTISYMDRHPNAVWPGFSLSNMPLISLVDDDILNPSYAHLYAYNFSPKNPDWQRIVINDMPVHYLDHDAYKLSGSNGNGIVLWGTFDIDDQSTFVFVTPSSFYTDVTGNDAVSELLHTRFHSMNDTDRYDYFENDYDGFNKTQIVKLTYLESNILDQYLRNGANDEVMKDAVAVHLYRLNNQENLSSYRFQQGVDTSEGVPTYVGYKALNLADKKYADFASPSCDINKISIQDIWSCDISSHVVLSGIAYGRGLDYKRGSSWKIDIVTREISMPDLLREVYAMSNDEIDSRARNILNESRYDYSKISQAVDRVMLPYLADLNAEQASYQQELGIEIQLYLPQYDASNLHWNKKLRRERVRYPISTNVDFIAHPYGEYVFMVDGNNSLIVDYNNASYAYYSYNTIIYGSSLHWRHKFKIPSDAKLLIDGKEISAADFVNANRHVAYDKLKIETGKINVYAKGLSGMLEASNGVIKIKTSYSIPVADKDNKSAEARRNAWRKREHDKLLFGWKQKGDN